MACSKREQTCSCEHHQCEFPDTSQYECVEIVDGYCEIGFECDRRCPYSFQTEDKLKAAIGAFTRKYG